MNKADRERRNERALQMFVAGANYKQIAAAVDLSPIHVDAVVKAELAEAGKRRGLLSDQAFAIMQERMETLFQAHWLPAIRDRDTKSAEICRRILSDQARMYGLEAVAAPPDLPARPTDDTDDELAVLRSRRQA